ncbi:MAG: tRNA (adenosine(37)-N6)-threonylcarbamoyltransferase complex dimerization subunit type 1 TsaB [Candidatus Puniceispirillum sp.]|nr:tRNA (adenosine(37)-N6)-threonylcarbamoyltransferase complex dimerization subunit type 1 TsaB [Candidatus Puniceispirillum sp.]
MLTLTFETSNFGASAALFEDNALLCARAWREPHGQGAYLVKELKEMATSQGKRLLDAGQVITTVGPGSFTGQRIGLAVARTLAFAGALDVWGVDSFTWMAAGFMHAHKNFRAPFMVCLDTGRADRFCQLFSTEGTPLAPPCILGLDACETALPQDAALVGQAWAQHPRTLSTHWRPHAQDLILVPRERQSPLAPLYLREANTTL